MSIQKFFSRIKVSFLFTIFSLALLNNLCSAEDSALQELILPEFIKAPNKTFLWELVSDTNRVYILGSIHFAKKDIYPLDQKIEGAFNKSEVLVVEVGLSQKDLLEVQKLFKEAGIYPPGESLKDNLSTETLQFTREKLKDFNLDIEQLISFKPWYLAINLLTYKLLALGYDSNYGIDMYFENRAKGYKKILELESIEFQINLFNSLTDKQQDLFLFSTLLDIDMLEDKFSEIFKVWSEGDSAGLTGILQRGLKEHPEVRPIYEKILYERNKNMASKIENFATEDVDYFVIVGAAHLVGEEGIIKLLQEKGYFLQQL